MAVYQLAEGHISVTEAAKRVGVSRSAIYQAIREGRLPHSKISGVMTILNAADVEAFASQARKRGQTPRKQVREYTLEELVNGITEENRHQETDFGAARGNEVW